MDAKFLMTFKYNKIMSVALVVAEEQVLAMCGIDILPILQRQFYGRKRRMVMCIVFYAILFKKGVYFVDSFVHCKNFLVSRKGSQKFS